MNNRSPKVSVIIPTYNRAHYITEAIESVLAQTYSHFEIIVIDDGSTDDTREILKKYTDKMKYLYQPNQGVAVARNRGLREARGEYVAFLDSDDCWVAEKLEKQVAYLNEHPEVAVVCAEVFLIDSAGCVLRHLRHDPTLPLTFDNLFDQSLVHVPTTLVRKRCVEAVGGFDPSLRTSQDYDLWLRMSHRWPFHYMDEPLAKYRVHEKALTCDFDARLKNNLIIFHRPEITAGMSWLKRRNRIAKVYYQYAVLNFEANRFLNAASCFGMAILTTPAIGMYYWPLEARKFRFSLPYRLLKPYLMIGVCLIRWKSQSH